MINKLRLKKEFKRDYKRELIGKHKADFELIFDTVLDFLLEGKKVPKEFNDHQLIGDWKGFRECHLKPDLLLVYKITNGEVLLARVGSHTQIFKKF